MNPSCEPDAAAAETTAVRQTMAGTMSDAIPIFSSTLVRLTLPGIGTPDAATMAVSTDGDLVVAAKLDRFLPAANIPDESNLVGEAENGAVVTLEGAVVQHCSSKTGGPTEAPETLMRITALRMEFAMSEADMATWTRQELWLHGPRVFGPTRWIFGEYDFELRPHANEPSPGVRPTCLIVTRRTLDSDADLSQVLDATIQLLSVADRVQCRVFLRMTYCDNDMVRASAIPYPNLPHGTHPLIPPFDLPQFVVVGLPSYIQRQHDWSLKTLVGYYCRSHYEKLAEAKFIFASVFMEALKFNWALNVAKLPQDRKQSGLIRGFRCQTGGKYSFEELMQLVASDLKLNHTYTFIDDRNALFHSGQAATVQTGPNGSTWEALRAELVPLHNQMDDIILTLLQYSGRIRGYWDQSNHREFVAPK